MIVRTALLVVYAVVLAVALLVQFLYPALGGLVFYGLLFWLVASFFLFRLPGMGRPVPGSGSSKTPSPPPPSSGGSAPLPSGPPVQLEFCAYCGTQLAAGASQCPACGHPVRAF